MIDEHERIADELQNTLDGISGDTSLDSRVRGKLAMIMVKASELYATTHQSNYDKILTACRSVEACIGPRKMKNERLRQSALAEISKVRSPLIFPK